ncbi:MAG: ribonuclease Z [Magnetococcales bacterium]|nr:ribonuclease Z [Magnetococcales bacterium]
MQLTILGSGTGIPSLLRHAPGYLIQTDAMNVLVDCGSGTLLQLERAGVSFTALDLICITHTHADHIGDLWALVHGLRFPHVDRQRKLTIMGPPGFSRFFDQFVAPVSGRPKAFPFEIIDAAQDQQLGALRIVTTATVHSDRLESIAYRFEKNGHVAVISGDCDFDDGIIHLAKGADQLVLDCSSLNAGKIGGHLSAGECGKVAQQAGAVSQVILSHLYPIDAPEIERIQECRHHYDGKVILAEDLLTLNV